jgi:hypothetical protein
MRHSGKNAVVKNGSDTIDGLVSFDIEETAETVDLSAAGDGWMDHDTTLKGWSGSMTFRLDHEAVANQSLRAGDVIEFEGYTEGVGSGKTFLSGSATVNSHKKATTYNGESAREYSITGKGALAVEVVA